MSRGTAGDLSVDGKTAMYRYFKVQCGVKKYHVVWPAICVLKVMLQCTDIVMYKGGSEMSGCTSGLLSVEGDTAIYRYF
jgi:hypothetical protein